MPNFTITFHPYSESPTYDVLIRASTIETPPNIQQALFEGRTVTVKLFVDSDPQAKLDRITLKKMRGHIKVEVPLGWFCLSSANFFPDQLSNPVVSVVCNGRGDVAGYINQSEFKIGFVE